MGKWVAIGKFIASVAVGVISGIIVTIFAARYASNPDTQKANSNSTVSNFFYHYGTFVVGDNAHNQSSSSASSMSEGKQPASASAPPATNSTFDQQLPMHYMATDFDISGFKVTQSDEKAILTFAIWNKSNEILYITNNSARNFSVSSDGGVATSAFIQNLSSNYSTSDKPNSYTPISHGSTIYVSVGFPLDKVKGKIGNFNFNLVQLKNGKPSDHTFSEQIPLPQ